MSEILAIAGESWRLGEPECPPTERVLHAMAMVLHRYHLLQGKRRNKRHFSRALSCCGEFM
jgi:hypothetical protein